MRYHEGMARAPWTMVAALLMSAGAICGCNVVSGLTEFELAATGGRGASSSSGSSTGGGSGGSTVGESCLDHLERDPAATDGTYLVDPDGEGAFPVWCDMTIDGGGWTRFHWLATPPPQDTDPLGQQLRDCDPDGTLCRGRIPATASPSSLLVKDVTDDAYATWDFDPGNAVSNAVLGALRDKSSACVANQSAWMPTFQNSQEDWCGTGDEGGCDSFMYDQGDCMGLPGWTLELDGDLYFAKAAFKYGYMFSGQSYCAAEINWDHGYLDELGCYDELGEMYYR